MFDTSSLWGVLTIVGPVVLVVAIVWAMRNNRMTKAQEAANEAATRAMYEEQDRLDKANETR
ncbi:hypothetical protein [Sphingomonas japonica]|uniref:Membrane protein n=1 Tax=Sphingomonas japonica TaxID=511662 RepID=A0ABX0TYX8_9SPHN|nr:hypothetical protein [Sphingomonas japonica]NIJ23520.1 putative membrane protein [Sphingomonas japonica]